MRHILLAEACELERLGLKVVLKNLCPQSTISEAVSFSQADQILRKFADIDVVILNFAIPDENGTSAFFRLRKSFPVPAYALISGDGDGIDARVAEAMGATAHIHRTGPVDDIAKSLGPLVKPGAAPGSGDPNLILASLSPAQIRILKGLHKGLRNKQIAYEMGVTENTVRAYLSDMYRRLGVHSRTQVLFLLRDALAATGSLA